MSGKHFKCGNISITYITLCIIAILIVLTTTFISYYQFAVCVLDVKNEMFYTAQNAIMAYNNYELSYENYVIDENKLKEYVKTILNKNFVKPKHGITNIEVIKVLPYVKGNDAYVHTNGRYKCPIICIELNIEYTPIISLTDKKKIELKLHEDVKMSLLNYT